MRRPTAALVFVAMLHGVFNGQERQRPVIRSGVELLVVDVQVVDSRGEPILTLGPADFEVSLDRKPRRVVSAQLVRHTSTDPAASARASIAPRAATPANVSEGRRFILAVDEHSFRPANTRAVMHAANRFIDRLQPNDLVGLYTYPTGTVHSDLTNNHAAVRRKLDTVSGLMMLPSSRYNISMSEAVDIASGDREALARVARRECRGGGPQCSREIREDSTSFAGYFEMQVSQSLAGLRHLFDGLQKLEGRKTLVIISGGLFTSDSGFGRVKMAGDIRDVGLQAARSNTKLTATTS